MRNRESLKNRVYNYLQNIYRQDSDAWISGKHFEIMALNAGYKSSNVSRRCRELENESKIERRIKDGFVEYKFLKEQPIWNSSVY